MMYHLLIKTHNQTGLKYLCRHYGTRESCFVYFGSGLRWQNHLRKHGKDVSTEILFETNDLEKLKQRGIYYSNLWGVVENNNWANLIPEEGTGCGVGKDNPMFGRPGSFLNKKHTEEAKQKMRGRQFSETHRKKLSLAKMGKVSPRKGVPHTAEAKRKNSLAHMGKNNYWYGTKGPMFGRTLSIETKRKISLALKGRRHSEDTKRKISLARRKIK